jgi:hypothetical protein
VVANTPAPGEREPLDRLLVLLVLGGCALRLFQYARSGSFWLDEAWLATNVASRPLGRLLTEPLDYGQAAPPAFLVLSRLVGVLSGMSDQALRLVPCAAGIAALALAVVLSRQTLRTRAARAAFVGAVAFSPALVYYTSEFKQYSLDVLATLALVVLALRVGPTGRGLAALGLAGALAPWLSHAAPLVLVGVGVGLAADLGRSGPKIWERLLAVALAWSVSVALLFALSRAAFARGELLTSFWASGFAPLSAHLPVWVVETWYGLTHLAFLHAGPAGAEASPAWWGAPTLLLSLVVLIGLVAAGSLRRRLAATLGATTVAALAASAAGLYPLRGRLLLFAVPLVLLGAAYVVELVGRASRLERVGAAVAAVVVLAPLGVSLASYPWPHAGMEGALRYLAARREPGDTLVLDAWSVPALRFYAPLEGLADLRPSAPPVPDDASERSFREIVCEAAGSGRTWVLVTRLDLHGEALARLERDALRLGGWSGDGAAIVLVDARTLCGG